MTIMTIGLNELNKKINIQLYTKIILNQLNNASLTKKVVSTFSTLYTLLSICYYFAKSNTFRSSSKWKIINILTDDLEYKNLSNDYKNIKFSPEKTYFVAF